jgi:hypothetical protein
MARKQKQLRVYSTVKAAKALGKDPRTTDAMIALAKIPTCRVGRCNVIDHDGLEALRRAFENNNANTSDQLATAN